MAEIENSDVAALEVPASDAPGRARRGMKAARKIAQPPRNARKELVRERMLEKSAELFCARGFSKTSINDIADSLSLKRSSVYHYFQNKEEIIKALFLDEYMRRCTEIRSLFERKELSALERLTLAIEGAIAQRLKGGSRFLVFDRLESEVPDELRVSYNRRRREILELYTRLISDGVKANEFRVVEPQMAAFAVIGMSNWTALWYSPRGKNTPAEIAKILVDLFVNGIAKRDGERGNPETLASAVRNLREDLGKLEILAGLSAGRNATARDRGD